MMRKRVLMYIAFIGIIAAGVYISAVWKKRDDDEGNKAQKKSGVGVSSAIVEQNGDKNRTISAEDPSGVKSNSVFPKKGAEALRVVEALVQSNPDRKDLTTLDVYVSDEDYTKAMKLAEDLMYSERVATRQKVADTLGWIGVRGLPLLTKMLGDPDKDIATSVFYHWVRSIGEVNDETSKVELLVNGLSLIEDQHQVEEGFMLLNSMPQTLAVMCLMQIIERGDNVVAFESALEQYEFATDEEFSTLERAEQWIVEKLALESE